jgi:hypothetical protein
MTHEPEPQAAPASPRLPYVTPVLKVFGGVTAITNSRTKTGAVKDGGPNNSKT